MWRFGEIDQILAESGQLSFPAPLFVSLDCRPSARMLAEASLPCAVH
jgi:hypothetical protein